MAKRVIEFLHVFHECDYLLHGLGEPTDCICEPEVTDHFCVDQQGRARIIKCVHHRNYDLEIEKRIGSLFHEN